MYIQLYLLFKLHFDGSMFIKNSGYKESIALVSMSSLFADFTVFLFALLICSRPVL